MTGVSDNFYHILWPDKTLIICREPKYVSRLRSEIVHTTSDVIDRFYDLVEAHTGQRHMYPKENHISTIDFVKKRVP